MKFIIFCTIGVFFALSFNGCTERQEAYVPTQTIIKALKK